MRRTRTGQFLLGLLVPTLHIAPRRAGRRASSPWPRPAPRWWLAIDRRGALLVADDVGNVIWRW